MRCDAGFAGISMTAELQADWQRAMIDRAGGKSQAGSARRIVAALHGRLDIQGADIASPHYPVRHDICVTD
jgi:hypothetical protein